LACEMKVNKKMSLPKISVIVSYYKQMWQFKLLLESLSIQTYQNFEIIIADDNSKDNIRSVLINSGLKYKYTDTGKDGYNLAIARNNAAELATGELLVIVDADHIVNPGFLHDFAESYDEGIMLGTARAFIAEENIGYIRELMRKQDWSSIKVLSYQNKTPDEIRKFREPVYHSRVRKKPWIMLGSNSLGIPKSVFIELGGFDEDFSRAGYGGGDNDMIRRLCLYGLQTLILPNAIPYHLNHPVYKWKANPGGVTLWKAKMQTNEVRRNTGPGHRWTKWHPNKTAGLSPEERNAKKMLDKIPEIQITPHPIERPKVKIRKSGHINFARRGRCR